MHALGRQETKPVLGQRGYRGSRLGGNQLLKPLSRLLLLPLKHEDSRAVVEAHAGEEAARILSTHSLKRLQRAVQLSFGLPGVTFALQRRDAEDLVGRSVPQECGEARKCPVGLS